MNVETTEYADVILDVVFGVVGIPGGCFSLTNSDNPP